MDSSNEKDTKQSTQHVDTYDDLQKGPAVTEAHVASVALAQAIEQQKPSLWSKSMIKLYLIVSLDTLHLPLLGMSNSKVRRRWESATLSLP